MVYCRICKITNRNTQTHCKWCGNPLHQCQIRHHPRPRTNKHVVVCLHCNGAGCRLCGTGRIITEDSPSLCIYCNSTGRDPNDEHPLCPYCEGTGFSNGYKLQ